VIAALLYPEGVIAASYLGLKLYVIYKGVLRIINQAFIKEMINDVIGLKVDQMAMLAGILFAASLIIFPNSMILLFFNEQYLGYKDFLLLIGLSGMVFSLSSSLTTRSMLKHKDKAYAILCLLSMTVSSLLVIFLSFFYNNPASLGISLLCGELIGSVGLFIMKRDVDIKRR
jgi:O-antigen/teichoic acid export membrane protein